MATGVSFSSFMLPLVNSKSILNGNNIHHHPCPLWRFCGWQSERRRLYVHGDECPQLRIVRENEETFMDVGCSNPSTKEDGIRNTLKFKGSIWGDWFLTYDDEKEDLAMEKGLVEELIEVVRKELKNKSSSEPMQLIDQVQRLGIAYHFEDEIEEILHHVYATYGDDILVNNHSLQSVSLWFRLLRQHGFNVSSGT
ncbi:putative beta-farnesene synthase [Helianthus annuus]|nr:putative beta-farnesene synthase [Helianthus annuus]